MFLCIRTVGSSFCKDILQPFKYLNWSVQGFSQVGVLDILEGEKRH